MGGGGGGGGRWLASWLAALHGGRADRGGVKSELEFDSFFRQFNYFRMHTFNYIIGGINDEEIGESPS